MSPEWTIEQGMYGPRMVVTGRWTKGAFEAARSFGIAELELNHAKGWSGQDLSFLPALADSLEWFSIIDFSIDDITPVNALGSLRFLQVLTYCDSELRFAGFPGLEECRLEWRSRAVSLFDHRGVTRLFLNKWNQGRDVSVLAGMTQLNELALFSPSRLESLNGIERLRRLVRLRLALAPRLRSLAGIERLTELELLEIHTCRKIRVLDSIAPLSSLRELHVNNCGDIESIRPLSGLRKLETFLFYESTNVLDGDLSVLEHLPYLKDVAFQERRHYSHRRSDLP